MNAMTRWMRWLLIAALGAGLAGCGGGSSGDAAPAPPAAALRLDSAAAVTRTIGPAGGTVTTTAADGSIYTLTVPPKALRSATAITLAPIASIADLPAGVSLAGGAHLTPEGQAFDAPVKLSIALARPPSSAPIPFTYAGALMQRRLYPATLTANSIEFEIVHFSGYAALLGQFQQLLGPTVGYLPVPGAAGDQALQALVSASLQLTGEARSAAMRAALRGWLDTVIKPAVVSTQAITTIDVNPSSANAATIEATTRLRGEMQVFDIALKYAVLAGADVNALYPDFQVAVRDAARHVIPLFNAACSQFASAWFLAVPDVFAWQELARLSSATALEPALERAAVLDALCVQVAYDPNGGTDFPSGIQPGQTGTLGVRAGYTVNGGPVRFDEPMFVSARGTNTTTNALQGGGEPVAAGATYMQQFLWQPATTEMRIDIEACLEDPALRELCQQAFVVRGTPSAASRIRLSSVTDGEVQGACGHFSISAAWTDGSAGTPTVTWAMSRSEYRIESPSKMRFLVPYGSGPVTITATLSADPTQRASATVIVDNLIGLWDLSLGGRLRINQPPIAGTERHIFSIDVGGNGEMLHSGTTFDGSYVAGSVIVRLAGTFTDTTMTGTMTQSGSDAPAPTPFTGTRVCPAWP